MIVLNILLLIASIFLLIKFADYAVKYSSTLSKETKYSEFIISFFVITFISILPEATIAILSSIKGETGLALGTLLGANITSLTLIAGIVVLFSKNGIEIKNEILKDKLLYIVLLFFPLILGIDGNYSRSDGAILLLTGIMFFTKIYIEREKTSDNKNKKNKLLVKNLLLLALSVIFILIGAHLTTKFAINLAEEIRIPKLIMGMTVIALGVCLPELIFSTKAIQKNSPELALGDILGTIIANSTIVLGIISIISPFYHEAKNIMVTGSSMALAGVILIAFMKSDEKLKKIEGIALISLYILFLVVELFLNKRI